MKKMPGTIAKPSFTDVDYNGFYLGGEKYVAAAKETLFPTGVRDRALVACYLSY